MINYSISLFSQEKLSFLSDGKRTECAISSILLLLFLLYCKFGRKPQWSAYYCHLLLWILDILFISKIFYKKQQIMHPVLGLNKIDRYLYFYILYVQTIIFLSFSIYLKGLYFNALNFRTNFCTLKSLSAKIFMPSSPMILNISTMCSCITMKIIWTMMFN